MTTLHNNRAMQEQRFDVLQQRLQDARTIDAVMSRCSEATAIITACTIRLDAARRGSELLPVDLIIAYDRLLGQAQRLRRTAEQQLIEESRYAYR